MFFWHKIEQISSQSQFIQVATFCDGIAHSWNSRKDWVCPPKTIPEGNAKMLILLFYVLKHCFLR